MQHYPARLHQLYILELPIILRWVLGAVKHLIHPSTAARIRTCSAVENCLPLPLNVLDEQMSASVSPGSLLHGCLPSEQLARSAVLHSRWQLSGAPREAKLDCRARQIACCALQRNVAAALISLPANSTPE